jgi:tetratricopeptide (TPR) repeat protein
LNTTSLRSTTRTVGRVPAPGRAVAWAVAMAATLVLAGAGVVAAQETPAEPAQADVTRHIRDGNFYFAQGDCALSQYFFQEALKRDGDNVEALVGKGRALACQNAFNAAADSLQRAIEVEPRYVPAYVHLALVYQDQFLNEPTGSAARLGDALEVLQRAEDFAADDATVQNTKGIVLYQAGDLEQARSTLERAVELAREGALTDRERSTVHVNLGRTYRDLGQLELAQQAFRRAVVLDPTSATAHNNLGNVMYRLGDCPGAEYELAQAVSLAPNSLSAVSQLAIVTFECGDVAASIPRFERALQLDGAVFTPPLFTYLARAYMHAGRYDDAVRRAQQGALLPPESADAHYHLGQVYEARGGDGDRDAAARAYERALELDPDFEPARTALAGLR